MKKKLIISSYDDLKNPYFAGGGARAIHEVAKRLVGKGYAVTVITGKYPNSKAEIIDEVTYQRIGTSFLGAQLDQVTFQFCLPLYVLTKTFDVWVESFTPPFSTNFIQLFTKKPVIGLVHMLSGEDMKRKYKLPFDLIEKIGLKTYAHIIVPSKIILKKVRIENQTAKISIIPNGIDKIHAITRSEKKYILFLGRIEVDQKGLDLLLHAYSKIVKKITYPLYIAGSGEKKEEAILQKIIEKFSLTGKVKCLGKVNGAEKEKLYQEAFIVVITSRFETFSVVALEAFSYGKALIYFGIDGLQWIPKNAGMQVKPFDITQFAESMLTVVKDKKSTESMGKHGQAYAKQFTWEKIADEYEIFIANVLSSQP